MNRVVSLRGLLFSQIDALTDREVEVLRAVARRSSNAELADGLP